MVTHIDKYININDEFISLVKRNAHNGKKSIIYFGNHEIVIPREGVEITVNENIMNIYHNHILTAIINTDLIYGVSDERI